MKIRELLMTTGHRTRDLPDEPWRFYQEWRKVLFVHWEVDYDIVRQFIPDDLEIAMFDGTPWVSLVAFSMQNVRPRYLPPFPPVSNFDEVNFRTYVKHEGKEGVCFLSMECGKRFSAVISKFMSGLPYRYSKLDRKADIYEAENQKTGDRLEVQYSIKNRLDQKDLLDEWLTEKYALFQKINGVVRMMEVHHPQWQLKNVELEHLYIRYPRFRELVNDRPARAHFSEGVDVLAWGKK